MARAARGARQGKWVGDHVGGSDGGGRAKGHRVRVGSAGRGWGAG